MDSVKRDLSISELNRMVYDLRENNRLYLDNNAILNISGDDSERSLLPEGLHDHLFSIGCALCARNREIQNKISQEIEKIGRPVLVNSSHSTPGLLKIKILLPKDFRLSNECQKELDEAVNDTLIPIIEKHASLQIEQRKADKYDRN